ncbi:site-specific integrase [Tsuneonella sp. YG55]|uniref:Site-specific integrase n=1 Tax=Tsuneonella litorea TaxID=2976475 RepID=A0A9X2W4T8_9SPHN|nr:site-specific integrase [Tsuneonella litorea]MCT2560229.1 site-specific integrase [Tsuneonella litorea]
MFRIQTNQVFQLGVPTWSAPSVCWRTASTGHPGSPSFSTVASEWLAKNAKEGRASATLRKMQWLIDLANSTLGERPISEISPSEVLAVLRQLEARGLYESARRMRSVFGRVFRYAIATSRATRNPASELRGAVVTPQVRHRAALTRQKDVASLLRAIGTYQGSPLTALALKLSAHTFVRPGELRTAEWSEIERHRAVWWIPASKMKMRRPHGVPLSRQVISLLEEISEMGGDSKFVFPSARGPHNCMCENTVNQALRRLGFGPDQMTAHGFRAMAASLLNEMGTWHPDAIERQLAHQDANPVRRAYNRAEFWEERIRMMQHWSDYLIELEKAPPGMR